LLHSQSVKHGVAGEAAQGPGMGSMTGWAKQARGSERRSGLEWRAKGAEVCFALLAMAVIDSRLKHLFWCVT